MTTALGQEDVTLDEAHVAGLERVLDTVVPGPGTAVGEPPVVPLAYLSVITPFDQPLVADLRDELGMPYLTTAADHVTLTRELAPGETLAAELFYDGVVTRERPSGGRVAFANFRRTFTDGDGSPVAVVRWVCALMDEPAVAGATTAVSEVGTPHTTPVTADLAQDWADWTGDQEPIHLDPATAHAAGLPGPVAHASLVTAMTERLVRAAHGGLRLRELELRHRGGVFFGDTVGLTPTGDDTFLASSARGPVATVTGTVTGAVTGAVTDTASSPATPTKEGSS
jgi:acyl dehydratase